MAISHPSRILSLISIYGSTGNPELPRPKPEILALISTPPPTERHAFIDYWVNMGRKIIGSGFPVDEVWRREIAGKAYDRSFYPQGVARQFVAGLVSGNRRPDLALVNVPTLVIHGDEDPLVLLEDGKDTAEAIPGAELMIIKGMGHYIPHGGPWPQIVEAITEHTIKAHG
jgi:pimeloyl-ACP methyl ester carboxylesterase